MVNWLNACTSIEELPGGQHRAVVGIKPRAYLRDGSWRAMSFRLGDTGDPVLPHGLDEYLSIRFADKLAGQSPIVHVGRGQKHIRMTALATRNVPGSVVYDATGLPIGRRYNNAWTGADLEYLAGGHYLRKNVYLKAGHPAVFEFRIDGLAGVLSPSARGWDLLDDAGRPVLWAGAGFLYRPDSADGLTVPVSTTVRVQGGKSIYRYELPAGDWAGWVLEPTWTSQPDATEGQDTYIWPAFPTSNFGVASPLRIGEDGGFGIGKGMLQFSLTGLPSAAVVSQCSLSFNVDSVYNNTARSIGAHRALTQWFEGVKDAAAPDAGQDGSTWNRRNANGAVVWAGGAGGGSGSDYAAAATASVSVTATGAYTITGLAADVVAWLSGTPNYGWWPINADQATTNSVKRISSSDSATASQRPSLAVVYSLPGGGIGRGRIPVLARGGW